MYICTLMACFLLLIPQFACGQEKVSQEDVLKFCVFPNKSPKILYSMYNPLVKWMSEATGRTIKPVTAPDIKTFKERAMAGEYDMAVACISCYFQLRDKRGYRAIARGEPSFRAGVIVKKESPVTDPMQLQGKKVAVRDQQSYAGYLFFRVYLARHGVADAAQPEYLFLDQMESLVYAVLSGQADACVIRLDALNGPRLSKYKEQVRVILESPEIPQFPFIISSEFDPHLTRLITGALTSMQPDNPAAEKLFQVLNITSLHAVSDADYEQFEHEYKKAKEIAGEARGKE